MRGVRPFRHRAFALVELLVTMAIIVLLIAVLLPALAAARQASQDGACAIRLHQVMVAESTHAGDHDGRLTPLEWMLAGDQTSGNVFSNWMSNDPPMQEPRAAALAYERSYGEPEAQRGFVMLGQLATAGYLEAAKVPESAICPAQADTWFNDPEGSPEHPNYAFSPRGEVIRRSSYVRRKFFGDYMMRWGPVLPVARLDDRGSPERFEEPFDRNNMLGRPMQPRGIRLVTVGSRAVFADVHSFGSMVEDTHGRGVNVATGDGAVAFTALAPQVLDETEELAFTPGTAPRDTLFAAIWRYFDGVGELPEP